MTSVGERSKARLREYVQTVWVDGDLDAIEEYVKPGYVEHNLAGHNPDIEGIDAHRQSVDQFTSGFPDLQLDVEQIVASGNRTAQRFTCRGTHEGALMGTPPTGESVSSPPSVSRSGKTG